MHSVKISRREAGYKNGKYKHPQQPPPNPDTKYGYHLLPVTPQYCHFMAKYSAMYIGDRVIDFLKFFWRHIHMSFLGATGTPVFVF